MNTAKIQKELLAAMLRGRYSAHRPAIAKCGEHTIYSADGFVGFALMDSELLLDKRGFRVIEAPIAPKAKNDQLLEVTPAAYIYGSTIARRYTSNDQSFPVYINQVFLRHFDYPTLYSQASDSRVLVYEKDLFVGVVYPIRGLQTPSVDSVLLETGK